MCTAVEDYAKNYAKKERQKERIETIKSLNPDLQTVFSNSIITP